MCDCYFCQVLSVTKSRQARPGLVTSTQIHGGSAQGSPPWRQTKLDCPLCVKWRTLVTRDFLITPESHFISLRPGVQTTWWPVAVSGPAPGDTSTCQQPVTSTLASSKHQDIIQRANTHSSVSGQGYTQWCVQIPCLSYFYTVCEDKTSGKMIKFRLLTSASIWGKVNIRAACVIHTISECRTWDRAQL